MPKLDTATLESLLSAIFRGGRPPAEMGSLFSDSAGAYTAAELVDAFESLRRVMQRLLASLTDEQTDWRPDDSTFSLSEIFSHVSVAQNVTHNLLVVSTSSDLPHIDPVPRTAGGGSERGVGAAELRTTLQEATARLVDTIHKTLLAPAQQERPALHPLFGPMSSKGVLLFQLGHDIDHLKQAQLLRRTPGFPLKVGRDSQSTHQPT